jgi:hypothetical protein
MAQFQILYLARQADWQPVTTAFAFAPMGEQQFLWPSFEEAESARKRLLSHAPDTQFRIALAGTDPDDVDWQTRERLRFADGSYVETPWHDESWYQASHDEHFCHVSKEQAGKIAFTENKAKGQLDRQLVMSPGRYLNRYFAAHLDNQAIEGWCAKLSVLLQEDALKITQDPDEIEDVYVGGPNSCMANEACDFDGPCHPVRAYAGPDTALAYLGSRDDATARSIVWPTRLIYTSIYGDVSRLRLILEAAGYSEGRLDGARIQRIEHGGGFVVPYIDRGGGLADNGEYLVIGHGSISCDSTSGFADIPWYCPRCNDPASPHEEVFSANGRSEQWCYDCFHTDATYCAYNERHYSDDEDFITVYRDGHPQVVLEKYAEDYGAVFLEDRGEWWDSGCCGQCEGSGDWFHRADLTEYQGEWLSDAYLPVPFDDDDGRLLNAHILARHRFQAEQAAGEGARGDRLRDAPGEPPRDGETKRGDADVRNKPDAPGSTEADDAILSAIPSAAPAYSFLHTGA